MSNGLRFASMDVLPPALRARIEAQTAGTDAKAPEAPKRKYRNEPTAVDGGGGPLERLSRLGAGSASKSPR